MDGKVVGKVVGKGDFTRTCCCGATVRHKSEYARDKAVRIGLGCKSCSMSYRNMANPLIGANNPFYGKTHTEESKAQSRATHQAHRHEDWYRHSKSRDVAGVKNPMFGRKVYDCWVATYGQMDLATDGREGTRAPTSEVSAN